MRLVGLALVGLLTSTAAAQTAEKPLPTTAERAFGLERFDGFVPFYWDAKKGQLLLEIAPADEPFLYGVGLASGAGILEASLDRGELGQLGLCRFERVGPRVLLRQLQTAHRSGVSDGERTRVVTESFPSSVLGSLALAAEDRSGSVLVDATDFLLKDPFVVATLKQAQQGDWRHDRDRSAFNFDRTGAFPRNTEIEATLTFSSDAPPRAVAAVLPDRRSMSLRIHHTFLHLPEPGYVPRNLDPRVGFIPQAHRDHTAPFTEPIERYLASRWRLEKRDPQAAISEPKAPIVYYLDRGMPEPERAAVREAALWWNHAFERAGFKEALVILDLPVGATFLDARYSGIEWINRAERAWSIGDFQVDPRTGEILHAVARIDSHRRRTTSRVWQNMRRPGRDRACLAAEAPDVSALLASEASDDGGDEQSLVLARLRYLSAHEVGHTLGLMHNWAATTFGWGSVMDYLAAHVEVRDAGLDVSDAFPKDVGPYDTLMIEWGYTAANDAATLDAIVRAAYAKGIVYPLESDPRWAEYDWGADPVAWLKTTMAVRKTILDRFGPAQLKSGAPLYDLQSRFSLAYMYHRFGIQAAQQFVGGQYQTNALAGDGQTPTEWVPAAKQREALALLIDALRPENLEIPERIVASLVAEPSGTEPTRERFASEAGATFSPASAARALAAWIVGPLLDPERAARLSLAGSNGLTLEETLTRLVDATWHRPETLEARQRPLRRVVQGVVLESLLDLAASPGSSPEVRAATMARIEALGRETASPAADSAESAHRSLARREIREFLDHPETRRARGGRLTAPPGRPIGGPPEQR